MAKTNTTDHYTQSNNCPEDIILVSRGEVRVSNCDILRVNISSCVAVCLYHPEFKFGGITHISSSRMDDVTPSGRYIKETGFHYADRAIDELLRQLKVFNKFFRNKSLNMLITGGFKNEGPIR